MQVLRLGAGVDPGHFLRLASISEQGRPESRKVIIVLLRGIDLATLSSLVLHEWDSGGGRRT